MFQGSNWETKEGPGKAGKTSCRAGIGQGYTQSKKDRTMNWDIITRIQRFTLMARHNLEREAAEQLEGIYGWLPDGSFTGEDLYSPALIQVEEAKKTRTSLENYAAAELSRF